MTDRSHRNAVTGASLGARDFRGQVKRLVIDELEEHLDWDKIIRLSWARGNFWVHIWFGFDGRQAARHYVVVHYDQITDQFFFSVFPGEQDPCVNSLDDAPTECMLWHGNVSELVSCLAEASQEPNFRPRRPRMVVREEPSTFGSGPSHRRAA